MYVHVYAGICICIWTYVCVWKHWVPTRSNHPSQFLKTVRNTTAVLTATKPTHGARSIRAHALKKHGILSVARAAPGRTRVNHPHIFCCNDVYIYIHYEYNLGCILEFKLGFTMVPWSSYLCLSTSVGWFRLLPAVAFWKVPNPSKTDSIPRYIPKLPSKYAKLAYFNYFWTIPCQEKEHKVWKRCLETCWQDLTRHRAVHLFQIWTKDDTLPFFHRRVQPFSASNRWGIRPAWDYCVNDNFDIDWHPKHVADKGAGAIWWMDLSGVPRFVGLGSVG